MSYSTIEFSVSEGLARITLNRPDSMNAMNLKLMHELMMVAIECDENSEIRAVLLTGNGKMFSAGGDLAEFGQDPETVGSLLKEATTYLHSGISRLARMEKPLVIAINGTAAGAGMSLALLGDYSVASENAAFTMAYTAAALTPDGGSTYLLPRLIGIARTKELMITNRKLSAQEALEWGMINAVAPAEETLERAEKIAKRLAQGPTGAFADVKALLSASGSESFESQMELEARSIAKNAGSQDGKEGIAAFLNKRKPVFSGKN